MTERRDVPWDEPDFTGWIVAAVILLALVVGLVMWSPWQQGLIGGGAGEVPGLDAGRAAEQQVPPEGPPYTAPTTP